MKFLLDGNLSHRLVPALVGAFPDSCHVRDVGLARASDLAIWQFARENDFAIVSLDSDFYDLSVLRGWPPKVVWLRTLDTSTPTIREIRRSFEGPIARFLEDKEAAGLVIMR